MNRMLLLFALLLGGACSAAPPYFTNPVVDDGADPWIVRHEGRYYYCCALNGNIGVSVSDNLHEINPPAEVWKRPIGQWNSECVWAPELHPWNGKWYIIYAAGYSGPPYTHQKTGVLESLGDDPMGPYTDKGIVYTGDSPGLEGSNIWAIDMTLWENNGRLYGIWSGWGNMDKSDKIAQNLYISPMENPWTSSGPRVLISEPELAYETQGSLLPINEGPQILKTEKQLFVVYSCGQSWLDTYKLSWLRLLSPDADPLRRESWEKSPVPVFTGNEHVHGVGHASFTLSPDGREHYIIYHTKKSKSPGWDRNVWMQRFTVGDDGYPVFGEPIGRGVRQELPSGTKQ